MSDHALTLIEQSQRAYQAAVQRGWVSDKDSSLLFVDWDALEARLAHLSNAFGHPHANHCVAIKTMPHQAVLNRMVAWGYGLEAASMEEVYLAIEAKAKHIIFDSPVKRSHEIEACQAIGDRLLLNVNSLEELERMPEHPSFQIGIRINPEMQVSDAALYHVSGLESKFGVPISDRSSILHAILKYPVTALHVHSGSSMSDLTQAVQAVNALMELAKEANDFLAKGGKSRRITVIDMGGGLSPEEINKGESYMQTYASALKASMPELWSDFHLVTEFGQWTHFHTGFAISDVEYAMDRGNQRIAFIHLGADFLMRDAYSSPRGIPLTVLDQEAKVKVATLCKHDIAGPLCFAGDYVVRDVTLPRIDAGDKLLMRHTGSNAYALWSRHCSRDIPKVIGVSQQGKQVELLSERKQVW